MSVKEAELSELELDAKLEAKRSEIAHLKRGPASQADDGSTPAVLEIGGVDGKFVASLVMPGGNVQSVRVGDTVGGWGVRQITVDAITLGRGKESKRLTFGAAATPAAGAAVPPGATSPNAPSLLAPRAQ
ncbi:type IV pilus biogenesis protein PilP [Hydrogenophaga sp. BPS33]|uniref:type IV pilus biogenesis protein PilP n=1 Tax=Hydrogenophaga sp. BPS33 TaxID=2651974 RepID=UPI00131F5DF5|nr:type IV pilus biogenesis protein PilP [Hydrogenophaga sp. BPS33]QHE89338.1 type IV pilus biogenesis protein PilP [Hydrogenophaga sp. BPS33]